MSLYDDVFSQLWRPLLLQEAEPRLGPKISDAGFLCAAAFFVLRYLHGLAALQEEMLSQSRRRTRRRAPVAETPVGQIALLLLRCSPGHCIYHDAAARTKEALRTLTSTVKTPGC